MGRARRSAVAVFGILAWLLAGVAPALADPGMLTARDVGVPVISKPHRTTVIVYDNVVPESCEQADQTEHAAVVASFGTKNGPTLNEIVYEFDTAAEAKAFFAATRRADRARAACGTTANATILGIRSTPKGVGDARYTVESTEDVAGAVRKAIAVQVLVGDRVVATNFLDWGKKQRSTTTIVKRAVSRLG